MTNMSAQASSGFRHISPRRNSHQKTRFEDTGSYGARSSGTSGPGRVYQDDPTKPDIRSGRSLNRGRSPASRSSSRSVSPLPRDHSQHRSASPTGRKTSIEGITNAVKPWFKKKTLWVTVGTLAAVVALIPASVSAQASKDAADASKRSAHASRKSARAVERSANAVVNSTVAQGHQDHSGRYAGPGSPGGGVRGGNSMRKGVIERGGGGMRGRRSW
jgi:hypothetical protein